MAATKIQNLTALPQSRGLDLKEKMMLPCVLLRMRDHHLLLFEVICNYSVAKHIHNPSECKIQHK